VFFGLERAVKSPKAELVLLLSRLFAANVMDIRSFAALKKLRASSA
jgi:hypothetical protein